MVFSLIQTLRLTEPNKNIRVQSTVLETDFLGVGVETCMENKKNKKSILIYRSSQIRRFGAFRIPSMPFPRVFPTQKGDDAQYNNARDNKRAQ